MTNIERKALELVHEVVQERSESPWIANREADAMFEAFCRAIEQHEAFRQEVSDAVEAAIEHFGKLSWTVGERQENIDTLSRFIIAKPDPLVEVSEELKETYCVTGKDWADALRAAIAKRGGRIVFDD